MIKRFISFLFGRKRTASAAPIPFSAIPSAQPANPAQKQPGTRHQEINTYTITDIINGRIQGNIETRDLNGQGVTVNRIHSKILTARSTLSDADKIIGICDWCGLAMDTPPASCDFCSISLCTKDILCIQTSTGIVQGCPRCIGGILRNWNQWLHGPPPVPFSITKLSRNNGASNG